MNRLTSFLLTALAGWMILGMFPGKAEAQRYRVGNPSAAAYRYGSTYHPTSYHPNHMPGWDWERTYPWSPYNYGRNPYNPIVLPYPPYYGNPYPPLPPYYPNVGVAVPPATYPATPPDGAMFPSNQGARVMMPQPTGQQSAPPPDAALVLVRVPDEMAQVLFNGERTYTMGTTRYFVTPSLQPDKGYTYTVTANFKRDGKPVSEERSVKVTRGHTTVVDFTRPQGK